MSLAPTVEELLASMSEEIGRLEALQRAHLLEEDDAARLEAYRGQLAAFHGLNDPTFDAFHGLNDSASTVAAANMPYLLAPDNAN